MSFDTIGLEVLDAAECLMLLGTVPLGRIAFTDHALPAIQPVNFLMDGDDVIIRTAQGSKLAAAARNAIVAFEADDYDAATRTGWSVVVVGQARMVSDTADLAALRALPLLPWAPGRRENFIRIHPELISGRRAGAVPAPQ